MCKGAGDTSQQSARTDVPRSGSDPELGEGVVSPSPVTLLG